jgi:alpha-galactosidase
MQRSFLQFMPPELMGAHIGTAPAHSTGRSQSLDFRAAVALQGNLGVEFDVTLLAPGERRRLTEWIAFYKQWRHLLHKQMWAGDAGDGMSWHAAGNSEEWLLIVYRTMPMQLRHAPPVRLPFVDLNGHFDVMQTGPGITASPVRYDGSWLMQAGLTVPPTKAETAICFHGKRQ